MNTITAMPPQERRDFWRPSSPAQWAYAAGSAILAAGFVLATPGIPSQGLGLYVITLAAAAFVIGGLIESDSRAVLTAFIGAIAGCYVVTSSVHQTATHERLTFQFLAIAGVVLLVGSVFSRRQARAGR
jgi:hypothetical protein